MTVASKIILNSKFFEELSPLQLGEKMIDFGYDGIDVCVRSGHPINFGNMTDALPQAVKVWENQGLVCPMVSAPVDFTDPDAEDADRLYEACSGAGVPIVKIGYWKFAEGDDYWQSVARIRDELGKFADLSRKYGVKTVYHTHSGKCMGSNCAGLMHLIRGFEPQHIGGYADFGHMALDGEDPALGLAMIGPQLSVAGVKDGFHAPNPGKIPSFKPQFANLGEGSVDWIRALKLLENMGFEGPLSVHTEYEFDEAIIRQVGFADSKPPGLEDVPRADVAFLRQIMQQERVGVSDG